jgi:hypothetical protein
MELRRRHDGRVSPHHPTSAAAGLWRLASRLLLPTAGRFGGKAEQHMAQTVIEWIAREAICIRTYPASMTVRVWRRVAGVPHGLFTYAGAVDAAVLSTVMQQVERLTHAASGRWRVEVVASGLDGALLRDVVAALHGLRRRGVRSRFALAPRRRLDARTRLGQTLSSTLLH